MNQQILYGIIGKGALSRHLEAYFSMLGIPFVVWHRGLGVSLEHQLEAATHIILAINDDAIVNFFSQHQFLMKRTVVHCSGSVYDPHIPGCHPLMSFGGGTYSLALYQAIPFVCDSGCTFNELFPGLPNKAFYLTPEQKIRYHLELVMAGNFSTMLWLHARSSFINEFNIDPSYLAQYLEIILHNVMLDPAHALTRPLVRGDTATINRHIELLKNNPWEAVYKSFISCFNSGACNEIHS